MSHFIKMCKDCDAILAQCRCNGNKFVERVPCPNGSVAECKHKQKAHGVEVKTPDFLTKPESQGESK